MGVDRGTVGESHRPRKSSFDPGFCGERKDSGERYRDGDRASFLVVVLGAHWPPVRAPRKRSESSVGAGSGVDVALVASGDELHLTGCRFAVQAEELLDP